MIQFSPYFYKLLIAQLFPLQVHCKTQVAQVPAKPDQTFAWLLCGWDFSWAADTA